MAKPYTCNVFGSFNSLSIAVDNQSLIEEYISWKRSYAQRAAQSYKIWVTRFQEFANKIPERLLYTDWVAFLESLKASYAEKSVQYAMNIVHNYLRFYAEQGRLRIPLYLLRVPRADANSFNAVSEEEYRMMLAALKESRAATKIRDMAIVMLLHDTGMRVGELVAVEIDDIEEDRSAIIRSEKSRRNRRVFWNIDTDDVLQALLVERVNGNLGTEALFVAQRDLRECPLRTRSIQRIIEDTARLAGIARHICPHSFRHAFIHRLAKLSVPDALIAQLVGHVTPHTIAHYTKLSRPDLEAVARKQFLPAS